MAPIRRLARGAGSVTVAVPCSALSPWRRPQGPVLVARFAGGTLGGLATVAATRRA